MDNNPNISHPSSGTVPNTELIMNNQLNNMQPNIKTEDSPPAEEALDMLLQNEGPVSISPQAVSPPRPCSGVGWRFLTCGAVSKPTPVAAPGWTTPSSVPSARTTGEEWTRAT